MVAEQPARKVQRQLRDAGFTPVRARGSHTWWQHPSGTGVAVPDGHKIITPGVYRKIIETIETVETVREEV